MLAPRCCSASNEHSATAVAPTHVGPRPDPGSARRGEAQRPPLRCSAPAKQREGRGTHTSGAPARSRLGQAGNGVAPSPPAARRLLRSAIAIAFMCWAPVRAELCPAGSDIAPPPSSPPGPPPLSRCSAPAELRDGRGTHVWESPARNRLRPAEGGNAALHWSLQWVELCCLLPHRAGRVPFPDGMGWVSPGSVEPVG